MIIFPDLKNCDSKNKKKNFSVLSIFPLRICPSALLSNY